MTRYNDEVHEHTTDQTCTRVVQHASTHGLMSNPCQPCVSNEGAGATRRARGGPGAVRRYRHRRRLRICCAGMRHAQPLADCRQSASARIRCPGLLHASCRQHASETSWPAARVRDMQPRSHAEPMPGPRRPRQPEARPAGGQRRASQTAATCRASRARTSSGDSPCTLPRPRRRRSRRPWCGSGISPVPHVQQLKPAPPATKKGEREKERERRRERGEREAGGVPGRASRGRAGPWRGGHMRPWCWRRQ